MDDLRNSINANSEIQDLRSQMNKMYTEEELLILLIKAKNDFKTNEFVDHIYNFEIEEWFNKNKK